MRPGSVRIEVTACGVNYVDTLIVQGRYQVKPPLPFTPGWEVVGRVTEVADDVGPDVVSVGDRVFAAVGTGGYASEVVTEVRNVSIIGDAITDGQAATFMQSYMTGMFALRNRARASTGQSMLVIGAGGGVGLAAVDIGVMMGLRVFAAASTPEKRQLALDRGAEVAFDVRTDDIKTMTRDLVAPHGYVGVDHVYDPVGGDRAETWLRCLGDYGHYHVVGFVAGIPTLPLNQVLLRNRAITGIEWGAWARREPAANASLQAELLEHITAGELNPVEPQAYPLDEVVRALDDLASRRVAGKVVLVP